MAKCCICNKDTSQEWGYKIIYPAVNTYWLFCSKKCQNIFKMKKLWYRLGLNKTWKYFLPLLLVIIAWCYVNLKQFFIEKGYVYNPPIVPILEIQPYEQK